MEGWKGRAGNGSAFFVRKPRKKTLVQRGIMKRIPDKEARKAGEGGASLAESAEKNGLVLSNRERARFCNPDDLENRDREHV